MSSTRFAVGNVAALRHGARSETRIRRRSGYVKQALLRPLGLRQIDLDPMGRAQLDLYARCVSKIAMWDESAVKHGFLDAEGKSPPWIKEYFAAINTASRLLARLEERIAARQEEDEFAHYRELTNGG